jgi:hypothetical protein
MEPWLRNLNDIYSPGLEFGKPSVDPQQTKLKEVVRLLIALTVNDPEVHSFVSYPTQMFPIIAEIVWINLAQKEITPFILDALLQTAIDHGVGSAQAEVAANIAVTLASRNVRGIAGKVFRRIA